MGLVISFGVDGKFDGKLLRERKRETRSTVFLIGPKISPDRRHDFRLIAWGSSAPTPSRVSVGIENISVLDCCFSFQISDFCEDKASYSQGKHEFQHID
jgi:hypothetical protein